MREERLDCNGMELCICRWGEPEHPAVVILHGLMDQGAAWGPVASTLVGEGYQVVAPDQRGHGLSAHAPPSTHYHFPDYAADLGSMLGLLGVEPVLLVGHSMGGAVASLHAALAGLKGQLVLIEGLGPAHEPPDLHALRYRTHLSQRRSPRTHRPISSMRSAEARIVRGSPGIDVKLAADLARRSTKDTGGGLIWTWDPRHRERAAIGFDLSRHLEILSMIAAPVSLIFGERSPYLKLQDLEQRIGALKDLRSRHMLPSGHSPHYECPAELAGTLLKVLQAPSPVV